MQKMSGDNDTSQMGGFCRDASDMGQGVLMGDLGYVTEVKLKGHADEFGLGYEERGQG